MTVSAFRPFLVRCCCWLMVAGLALATATAQAGEGKKYVSLKKDGDKVQVNIDGQPFATYNTTKDYPKPFFSPVRSEGGTIVTRGLEKPEDHPHHKGIWLSIDEINGIKYWAEQGRIENQSVEILEANGNPAALQVTNHWLGDKGQTVLIETTKVSIFANRLMIYDIKFTAGKEPVVFEDTKEAGFGIRLANTMREKEGGHIVNAEGLVGEKEAWGKHSKWVDYYGEVEGETHGVALFDSPGNPHPSRYHVRGYGLFTLSPFGDKAYSRGEAPAHPLHLKPGQSYEMTYGIYIHPGDTKQGHVAEAYQQFLKQTGK